MPQKPRKSASVSRITPPSERLMKTKTQSKAIAQKPRVLILCHNHPSLFPGGTEIMAHGLFRTLAEQQQADTYFLGATSQYSHTHHPGTWLYTIPGEENSYLFWGDSFDYFLQSNVTPLFLHKELAGLLEDIKPDIIHFHHTMRLGMEAIAVVRRLAPNAKILYTLHDFIPMCHRDGQMVRTVTNALCDRGTPKRCNECFPQHSPAQFKAREHFVKSHFDLVDQFIAPSEFLRQRYISWGLPPDRIRVVRNGIGYSTPAPHRELGKNGRRNRFAYFGQLSPYKGALVMLEAVKLLLQQGVTDFHLAIHGNISLQLPEFEQRFQQLLNECMGHVSYTGRYANTDMPQLMAQTDWVVMPSLWWENSPLVIDEALLHRRPVICTGIGGMAEKISHEVNGLHCQPDSAGSLASVLRQAMDDPNLWNRLIGNIQAPPSMQDSANAHAALYSELRAEA